MNDRDCSPHPGECLLPQLETVWQETLNWQPNEAQQHLFQSLYETILAGNQQLNLTRIVEPLDFWEKHLWDSLAGVMRWNLRERCDGCADLTVRARIIDIGTGAGFPGLPVAIAFPNCQVTLLDSTRKKIHFLEGAIAQLGLDNAATRAGRAEQLGKSSPDREAYDLALVRAVGKATLCAQYALPLLKPGGTAVLYRGRWSEEEREQLQSLIEKWGSAIATVKGFVSPLTQGTRHCIYVTK